MANTALLQEWPLAAAVLFVDIASVVGTIVLDRSRHAEPPAGGKTDMSALIGWWSVCGAIFNFGSFGILIKAPAVVRAKVDPMIFTFYYGFATALLSFVIWVVAGSHAGLTFNRGSFAMGVLFGFCWTTSQLCAVQAINVLGYAVGPAIWIGLTICTSFAWGTAVFGNPVVNFPGAMLALFLLLLGVFLAALSSYLSDQRGQQQQCTRDRLDLDRQLTQLEGTQEAGKCPTSGPSECLRAHAPDDGMLQECRHQGGAVERSRGGIAFGLACCLGVGLFNGSLMVPLQCFQQGCSLLGIAAFEGDVLAPLAFLPSLVLGIAVVLPIGFACYFRRSLRSRRWPNFYISVAALPGLLTGMFWSMGNFNAMFATVYLGQTVGYPLTQMCLVVNGLFGVLYYKEISGLRPIGLFALATVVVIAGATLDGKYG